MQILQQQSILPTQRKIKRLYIQSFTLCSCCMLTNLAFSIVSLSRSGPVKTRFMDRLCASWERESSEKKESQNSLASSFPVQDQRESFSTRSVLMGLGQNMNESGERSHFFEDVGATIKDSPARERKVDKRPKRTNRPGKNSYLKVELDNTVLEKWHQLMQRLSDDFRARATSSAGIVTSLDATKVKSDGVLQNNDGEEPNFLSEQRRPLSIKVRSLSSLHMTLFFGGETLCALPAHELQLFHTQVAWELQRRNLRSLSQSDLNTAETFNADEPRAVGISSTFSVREICLFPPRRNNLVVAKLEAPSEWLHVHDSIRQIALRSDSKPLVEIAQDCGKPRWVPHVTLANVIGGSNGERQDLRRELQGITQELLDQDFAGNIVAHRVSMGGPTPQQAELDWNFYAAS